MDIKRPPQWKRILKRAIFSCATLFAIVVMLGFVVQRHRDADFFAKHPPPDPLMEVDGHRIHFRQSGAGDFTFVLEAGLGDYSGSWGTFETSLAGIGRVFVYDRAGLGWSEQSPQSRTAQQIATELHQVLVKAQIKKPYILVGHSSGAISQIRYAMEYPDEVAGLLLIDPGHKDQFKRLPAAPAVFVYLLPQITRAAPFGLPQLLFESSDPVQNLVRHVETSGAELRSLLNIDETWGNRPMHVGNIPLYVLTAGDFHEMPGTSDAEKRMAWETWKSLHAELVAGSSSEIRRQVIVEGATHYIHRTDAAVVLDAAKEMLARIKARKW
jgi:pimeloyl-ACP methyl ester carboxylesterase